MKRQINACPHFWDDIKKLRQKHKLKELKTVLEVGEGCSDYEKAISIPLVKAIVIFIGNVCDEDLEPLDRQPFIQQGWLIYKMRYAFNGKGKREGLRICFALTDDILLVLYINTKNECADEAALEKEIIRRLNYYLNL